MIAYDAVQLSANLMLAMPFWGWILVALAVGGVLMWPVSLVVASKIVYDSTLRRKTPDKWGSGPSAPDNPQFMEMDGIGQAWLAAHEACKREVHIVRDGLNLYGEYFDLGYDRAVMILSGRTESRRYGYFFAAPYEAAGCNILVVDPRAHGMSDGEFNTVGFEESRDALAWAEFLHGELGVRAVLYHGICIGAAGAVLAASAEDCPDYVCGVVAEGMFPCFGESMKNHLIERKKPVKTFYPFIDMWMKHYTGHSMSRGPRDVIHRLRVPLLMLHSREDTYSLPENARRLYELAGSDRKRLVWFEHGRHSMLRITDPALYDGAIAAFVAENFHTDTEDPRVACGTASNRQV